MESEEKRSSLLEIIQEIEAEVITDKDWREQELERLRQKEDLSDHDIHTMALLIEETQMPVFPKENATSEEEWLLQVLPKADIIVRRAFRGDPISENALGMFYYNGMVLPLDYAKQEYWFRCADMDGYDDAYDNLCNTFKEQDNKYDEWIDYVVTSARYGNPKAKAKCDETGVDCTKLDPFEWDMLDMYPVESLICNEPTEEQIALIEQFSQTADIQKQKKILRQLEPATTDYYLDAYLSGKPDSQDSIIDKLMDTDDEAVRQELVKELNPEYTEFALKEIPYMPLSDAEKRCVNRRGKTVKHRSPHRPYSYRSRWRDIHEKGLILCWMMDGDHRLTYDVVDIIFDRYEQRMIEDAAKRQEKVVNEQSQSREHDMRWFDLLIFHGSSYPKREAYLWLKETDQEISEDTLKKESARLFLIRLKMELNPVADALSIYESKCDFNRLKKRFKEETKET